ncbi:MAG: DUF1573 domain-containing protein [Sedimentisphaerales bacterium]|nr:DUF1573 domain-containing protein [Sedimentisphaerales bacterium]
MLSFQISKKIVITITFFLLILFTTNLMAQSERIITLKEIKQDKACGPKCLSALIQITKEGNPDCGIKCIYDIIDKEPFSATTLKDIKSAAEYLGFSAKGYKLTFKQLEKINGYVILPIGNATGTSNDPLHFILVKRITKSYVVIINTKTLSSQALPISNLQEYWNGYALVIEAGKGMKSLYKETDSFNQINKNEIKENIEQVKVYDQVKDFGQVDSGSIVEHTFTISNKKEKDYSAKIIQKSCSCINANLGKDIQGNHTLSIELRVDNPAWQEAYVVVLFKPGDIIKRYKVRAYGNDTFQITPRIGYIESPNCGLVKYPVQIDYFTSSDDIVKFNHMKSSFVNLKCDRVKSEYFTKGEVTTFTFKILLLFDANNPTKFENKDGSVHFILDTNKGQRDIHLKLRTKIGEDKFILSPEKVFFMTSDEDIINKKVSLEFMNDASTQDISIISEDNTPFNIEKTKVSDNNFMINFNVIKDRLKDYPSGLYKSEVIIIPKDWDNKTEIKIPISLYIR